MDNFRNVNNDILKEWFLFREDEIASLTCEEDKHHWVYFDEISQKILRNVPDKNKKFVQKNLMFLMIIFWIILVIGTRSIIGMVFVTQLSLLLGLYINKQIASDFLQSLA